jgi:biotin-dependent carboxylase-like uncharacterized protein
MREGLLILKPGPLTTVQDQGRIGYRHIGVPLSGALDGESLELANALVGNAPGAAALEILYGGPVIEVIAETVRVALGGGQGHIAIAGGGSIPAWQSVTLKRGEVFEVIADRRLSCCTLAVAGGIAVPLFLGSAATYVRAGIGGFEGRALKEGDALPLALPRAPEREELFLPAPPSLKSEERIAVVFGPQDEVFTDEAHSLLLESEFRVSPAADRMGMRLDGPRLSHRGGWDIVSDAIPEGAIQVPGSGQPIVLLADHPTPGGYPKIATVVSADLPVVGRRRPGDRLAFRAVAIEEAEALSRQARKSLDALLRSLEPLSARTPIDLDSLYGENLISGVVSGRD